MEIKEIAQKFLEGEGTLGELAQKYKVKREYIKYELESRGYVIKSGYKLSTIIGLKQGVDEYIKNINNSPSLTKICAKYHMNRKTLSDRLKELGYEIINHQNKLKFNENIFDSIDSEEKAYWLGFIYADGYIAKGRNDFELSLSILDKEHLDKFNTFMQYSGNNVKIGNIKLNEKEFSRCRWSVRNKHLHETLISKGCVPAKSSILQFPNLNIFSNVSLVKHFIRGYIDGDGCISYNDKDHTNMSLNILGTEDFLTGIKNNLPVKYDYVLGYNDLKKNNLTRTLNINGKNGLEILFYLYENSSIYLFRKYEKYKEYCRLYKELYKELSGNIGENPKKENPEINSEIKKSESSYSVEGETYTNTNI